MKFTVSVILLLGFASLGQAVRCKPCLSDDSAEDCDSKGKEVTCPGRDAVCMMYVNTKVLEGVSSSRYMRFCSFSDQLEALQEICSLKPLFIPGLGLTSCTAYDDLCSTKDCSTDV